MTTKISRHVELRQVVWVNHRAYQAFRPAAQAWVDAAADRVYYAALRRYPGDTDRHHRAWSWRRKQRSKMNSRRWYYMVKDFFKLRMDK